MKPVLFSALMCSLLVQACSFFTSSAANKPADSARPLLVVIQFNPWIWHQGSDSPDFALYSDGFLIYRKREIEVVFCPAEDIPDESGKEWSDEWPDPQTRGRVRWQRYRSLLMPVSLRDSIEALRGVQVRTGDRLWKLCIVRFPFPNDEIWVESVVQ